MYLIDIKDMPGFNPVVKNGIDSVSKGLVSRYTNSIGIPYAACNKHGAMNKVSKDGLWRCLQEGCHNGAYEIKD